MGNESTEEGLGPAILICLLILVLAVCFCGWVKQNMKLIEITTQIELLEKVEVPADKIFQQVKEMLK